MKPAHAKAGLFKLGVVALDGAVLIASVGDWRIIYETERVKPFETVNVGN